jgi:hypothetical protein
VALGRELIAILLAAWLVLNAAFVAMRFNVTADQTSGAEPDLVRYPRFVSLPNQRVFTGIKERYC